MLEQERMIERVREWCAQDDRLDAAMMYGSFTCGEGDAYSDIEFLLFFRDEVAPDINQHAWLEQIAPVAHLYVNEHGITAVIFENLVRGEFHFHSVAEMDLAEQWPGLLTFPSLEATLVVDKSGRLTPYLRAVIGPPLRRALPDRLQFSADSLLNWVLFGSNVLARGEEARALEILGIIHRHLLWLARAVEDVTDHWLTPSRLVEHDLSPQAYARFGACTASLDGDALRAAYRAAWVWGEELVAVLHARYGVHLPTALGEALTERLGGASTPEAV